MLRKQIHSSVGAWITATLVIVGAFPWPSTAQDRARPPRAYQLRLRPHWNEGGDSFWYRKEFADDQRQYILVDAVAGERAAAFDHNRLAKALAAETKAEVDPQRLSLDSLDFDFSSNAIYFQHADKAWKCDLESYTLWPSDRPQEERRPGFARHPADVPRRSLRTDAETQIHFVNRTSEPVQLYWISTGGERRSYGQLAAGREKHQHTFAGHVWLITDKDEKALVAFIAEENSPAAVIDGRPIPRRSSRTGQRGDRAGDSRSRSSNVSPDGTLRADIREGNVFLVNLDSPSEQQLTKDGSPESPYAQVRWSPDSQYFVAFHVERAARGKVYRIESSPRDGGRAKLHSNEYALPGDPFDSYQPYIYDVANMVMKRVDVEPIDFGRPATRFREDGQAMTYEKTDRGHQRFRLVEVELRTGAVRNIIDEQSSTFIWSAHTLRLGARTVTWLRETEEILYLSEKSGWRHIYLVDPATGSMQPVTKGSFVVRGIDWIDEQKRQVWFRASGVNQDQDPYLVHYYRVNFDGSNLVALTDGNGNHAIEYSPDRRFLIDTYSRVDLPPRHELRSVEDGNLICKLETADVRELTESGWQPPEVFTAKGRDGETDIWGIICRPRDFDPSKRYPIIEDIYAGPHNSFVPKSFSPSQRYRELTELGFVVVKLDGMGTANRSKSFHDKCWHNLKDAGFPDRIRWLRAAAQKYPHLDVSRVGIYGTSAGGQSAVAALLHHGDFYKAAYAACGCHDNRMDKASWNEQWMGYPVGPHYAESSNIDNAHKLNGKLMLMVGELDTNVPPESTFRLVDALIKADKDFELLVMPGVGHSDGGPYGRRRMREFFVRHLRP